MTAVRTSLIAFGDIADYITTPLRGALPAYPRRAVMQHIPSTLISAPLNGTPNRSSGQRLSPALGVTHMSIAIRGHKPATMQATSPTTTR